MLRELAARREDFALETTLSGRTYAPRVRELRASGYRVRLDFLWVSRLDLARERVSKGGHAVPEAVPRRRFTLGLRNLALLYRPLLDRWRLLDNSGPRPWLMAEEEDGVLRVPEPLALAAIEKAGAVRLKKPEARVAEESVPCTPREETRRALRALRRAYARAILENKRFGLPRIECRDGELVAVPAEELELPALRLLAANGEPFPEERQPR